MNCLVDIRETLDNFQAKVSSCPTGIDYGKLISFFEYTKRTNTLVQYDDTCGFLPIRINGYLGVKRSWYLVSFFTDTVDRNLDKIKASLENWFSNVVTRGCWKKAKEVSAMLDILEARRLYLDKQISHHKFIKAAVAIHRYFYIY